MTQLLRTGGVLIALTAALAAQRGVERWAVILEEPPVAARVASRKELRAAAAVDAAARIAQAQGALREELAQRGIAVTGAVQTLANAVFVRASFERVAELRSLPGVRQVAWMPPIHRHLDQGVGLINAPAAWNLLGGIQNAGAGVKIGVIDTGIDQTHPAFQDPSLSMPAGFPKCYPLTDCAYTNSKVIVARSYVDMLVWGDDPENSRPDDLSPRDRVGHGTAVATIAAGVRHRAPAATISGVAPKAYLGNYKVFGSPGVNDTTFSDVLFEALDDAFNDGMDIVTLALGYRAVYHPLDKGDTCQKRPGVPCDYWADAVDYATTRGMTVIASAGNDGDLGERFPTLGTIHTPGTHPAAVTVGASTNSHMWFGTVRMTGSDVPASLRDIAARFGDGPKPAEPLTAPLRDVSRTEPDGLACRPLGAGTLTGAVALIQRSTCAFATKVNHAQRAGAVAVILYQIEGSEYVFFPTNLVETAIPTVLIGNTDGKNLKAFLATRPDRPVTMDATWRALPAEFDTVADFTSRGPSIGDSSIKPELVAVGTDLYTATQRYDPNGDLYDASGYSAVEGTSFAAPMVAGVAALVKQRNPSFTAAQLKSALVNTATTDVRDEGQAARITAVGAGKLNAEAAVRASVTVEPATLSFGVVTAAALPISRTLRVVNSSASRLTLAVVARDRDANARLTLSASAVEARATASTAVRLEGSLPAAGSYEGVVTIKGDGVDLRVPYLYLVGDGLAHNIVPYTRADVLGVVNETAPCPHWIGFKLLDRFGVPVRNAATRFRVTLGDGFVEAADERTDVYGIAGAFICLGNELGEKEFSAEAGGLKVPYYARARLRPTISTNGVVNAASYEEGKPVAPGSYIAIFGRGLSETTRVYSTLYLPVSLAGVSVSFDWPQRGISLPGRLHFVSDGQINVQVPWELQGLNTVWLKVSIGAHSSKLYTLPLADAAPAFIERPDPGSGRLLIAALDDSYKLITGDNPARRGRVVQLYANALGPLDNQPPTGEPTPRQPLARTRVIPTVTVGGRPAVVHFSGLAPDFVGLYQLNVEVPADAPTGLQPLLITAGGVTSKAAMLPVQ